MLTKFGKNTNNEELFIHYLNYLIQHHNAFNLNQKDYKM